MTFSKFIVKIWNIVFPIVPVSSYIVSDMLEGEVTLIILSLQFSDFESPSFHSVSSQLWTPPL